MKKLISVFLIMILSSLAVIVQGMSNSGISTIANEKLEELGASDRYIMDILMVKGIIVSTTPSSYYKEQQNVKFTDKQKELIANAPEFTKDNKGYKEKYYYDCKVVYEGIKEPYENKSVYLEAFQNIRKSDAFPIGDVTNDDKRNLFNAIKNKDLASMIKCKVPSEIVRDYYITLYLENKSNDCYYTKMKYILYSLLKSDKYSTDLKFIKGLSHNVFSLSEYKGHTFADAMVSEYCTLVEPKSNSPEEEMYQLATYTTDGIKYKPILDEIVEKYIEFDKDYLKYEEYLQAKGKLRQLIIDDIYNDESIAINNELIARIKGLLANPNNFPVLEKENTANIQKESDLFNYYTKDETERRILVAEYLMAKQDNCEDFSSASFEYSGEKKQEYKNLYILSFLGETYRNYVDVSEDLLSCSDILKVINK